MLPLTITYFTTWYWILFDAIFLRFMWKRRCIDFIVFNINSVRLCSTCIQASCAVFHLNNLCKYFNILGAVQIRHASNVCKRDRCTCFWISKCKISYTPSRVHQKKICNTFCSCLEVRFEISGQIFPQIVISPWMFHGNVVCLL